MRPCFKENKKNPIGPQVTWLEGRRSALIGHADRGRSHPAALRWSFCTPPIPLFSCPHCPVGDKQPMILKWRILSATNDLDRVSAVALPKLPISLTNTDLKVASDTQFYPGLGMLGPEAPPSTWTWGGKVGSECCGSVDCPSESRSETAR